MDQGAERGGKADTDEKGLSPCPRVPLSPCLFSEPLFHSPAQVSVIRYGQLTKEPPCALHSDLSACWWCSRSSCWCSTSTKRRCSNRARRRGSRLSKSPGATRTTRR